MNIRNKASWWVNYLRLRISNTWYFRSIAFTLQNFLLAYYVNVFATSSEGKWDPLSIAGLTMLFTANGGKWLILSLGVSIVLVAWVPEANDPVLMAAEMGAAQRLPQLIQDAKSVEDVMAHLEAVKKGRKQ